MKKRLECNIFGRVQMVMYRDFVQRNATRLGLSGRVWNVDDGSVRVIAEGEESALIKLLDKLHKGPMLANVERVESKWNDTTETFTDFRISYM